MTITGTYSPAERENNIRDLEAVATLNGQRVRGLLLSRGVSPETILLNRLPSHPPDGTDSGAYLHVCARDRNVDGGWRDQPLDPAMLVPVRIGTAVLQVPIANLGPYAWNNVPVGETRLGDFYLDLSGDPASFVEAMSRCRLQRSEPLCERVTNVQVRRPLRWSDDSSRYDAPTAGPAPHWQRNPYLGGQRIFLTRAWVEGDNTVAALTCETPRPQPADSPFLDHARGRLTCSARLRLVPDRVDANFSFFAVDVSEAEVFMANARRALRQFAADQTAR
ncbi:hypothetical protein AAFN86_18155 [Roseomonas sp. CAU 1739]|uniref:hypothetical protein n=1 Tax=Roseomonas sp. CAU 1739 TaxID=3140364 RepID=UPI00325AA743